MTLEWLRTKVSQRCFGSGVRTGLSLRRYLPTVRGETRMVSFSFNSLEMRSYTPGRILRGHLPGQSAPLLGVRGLPTGRDFQRQRRRNPMRCQRMKVSGWTFTRASRHANRRPRITILRRVESLARCGYALGKGRVAYARRGSRLPARGETAKRVRGDG